MRKESVIRLATLCFIMTVAIALDVLVLKLPIVAVLSFISIYCTLMWKSAKNPEAFSKLQAIGQSMIAVVAGFLLNFFISTEVLEVLNPYRDRAYDYGLPVVLYGAVFIPVMVIILGIQAIGLKLWPD